ncbi:MAG: AbrB/MazE/SpoVT family DNA-binding domain-containing protein [Candidatus Woesearchaeota archaeon]
MDMEYAIAKMSTKGQIVIPKELREGLEAGDEFLIIRDEDRFVLKPMEGVAEELREDIEFSKRIKAAWERYDRGEFTTMDSTEFLEELKKW